MVTREPSKPVTFPVSWTADRAGQFKSAPVKAGFPAGLGGSGTAGPAGGGVPDPATLINAIVPGVPDPAGLAGQGVSGVPDPAGLAK